MEASQSHSPESARSERSTDELDATTREHLRAVELTSVQGETEVDPWDKHTYVRLALPHDCKVAGHFEEHLGDKVMVVDDIEVNPDLRGHGIGKRLLQSLATTARAGGAQSLYGSLRSEAALHNRLQTFGSDNVTIYEPRMEGGVYTEEPLPLSRDEAIASLRRVREAFAAGGSQNPTLEVKVDLANIDMTDWEYPIDRRNQPMALPETPSY